MSRSPRMWPWFPRVLAEGVRQVYPELWAKHGTGGNPPTGFTGDDAYRLWGVLRERDSSHPEWEAAQAWARQRRERYFSRHQRDYRSGGIIAAIKWGGVLPMRQFQPGADLVRNRDRAIQMMLDALDERGGTPRDNLWSGPWEGLSAGRALSTFPQAALRQGTRVEMEHTTDPEVARRIAADHLVESQDYYTALAHMERDLEARSNSSEWYGALINPEAVHASIRTEMSGAVVRAAAVGSVGPYEYVGAGATGIVLRDQDGYALKVGRPYGAIVYGMLEAEYEWLRDAATIWPAAVAPVYAFDPASVIIVKAYVSGRPYGWAPGSVHDRHRDLCRRMERLEWGAPEFKDDSYICTADGPVLVDAGGASRLGNRLAAFVRDWMTGRRPAVSAKGLADMLPFLLRREVQEGALAAPVGEALIAALAAHGVVDDIGA